LNAENYALEAGSKIVSMNEKLCLGEPAYSDFCEIAEVAFVSLHSFPTKRAINEPVEPFRSEENTVPGPLK